MMNWIFGMNWNYVRKVKLVVEMSKCELKIEVMCKERDGKDKIEGRNVDYEVYVEDIFCGGGRRIMERWN